MCRVSLSHVHVILLRPKKSANVGSVARVMQNFGLNNLRIVTRRRVPHVASAQAAILATPQAMPILNNALVFSSIEEAVADMNFVIGTTRRPRSFNIKSMEVDELSTRVLSVPPTDKVGVLFGPEEQGLLNEDLRYCDYTLAFPSNGSLNLSHAVLALGYELWKQATTNLVADKGEKLQLAPHEKRPKKQSIMRLMTEMETLIADKGIPEHKVASMMHALHGMATKAELSLIDVNVLFALMRIFTNKEQL